MSRSCGGYRRRRLVSRECRTGHRGLCGNTQRMLPGNFSTKRKPTPGGRTGRFRVKASVHGLDDFAGTQTTRAHRHPHGVAVDERANGPQVRVPEPLRDIVSVTDAVAAHGPLTANFARPSHDSASSPSGGEPDYSTPKTVCQALVPFLTKGRFRLNMVRAKMRGKNSDLNGRSNLREGAVTRVAT